MRLEQTTLLTIIEGTVDEDGFVTDDEIIETEVSASELSVKISDRIAGEHEGWHVSLKLAVDIDDYESSFAINTAGKRIRPQKLVYNDVTYIIKDPAKNLKTHQMELLCSEVE